MATIGEDVAAIRRTPHLHCAISGSRGDALAIGRPCYRFHNVGMPAVGEDGAAIGGIPDLHCLITAPGGDALTIGYTCPPDRVPCHRIHSTRMPVIGVESCTPRERSRRSWSCRLLTACQQDKTAPSRTYDG